MHSTDPRPLTLGGLTVPWTVSHLGCLDEHGSLLPNWEKDKKGFLNLAFHLYREDLPTPQPIFKQSATSEVQCFAQGWVTPLSLLTQMTNMPRTTTWWWSSV